MRWAIEIQKTSLDQTTLKNIFDALKLDLVQGIKHQAITSPEINACSSASEAFEQLRKLQRIMAYNNDVLELGYIIDYSQKPPLRIVLGKIDSQTEDVMSSIEATVKFPSNLSPDEIEKYRTTQYQIELDDRLLVVIAAFINPNAEKVIELLSLDSQTGESLYKIYELMESHPNNRDKFQSDFGITKETFKRFGSAVHNPCVTGDWARHAYDQEPVPNPMTKAEAENFIRSLTKKWLSRIRKEYEGNRK